MLGGKLSKVFKTRSASSTASPIARFVGAVAAANVRRAIDRERMDPVARAFAENEDRIAADQRNAATLAEAIEIIRELRRRQGNPNGNDRCRTFSVLPLDIRHSLHGEYAEATEAVLRERGLPV
jgi:hypothetical protein